MPTVHVMVDASAQLHHICTSNNKHGPAAVVSPPPSHQQQARTHLDLAPSKTPSPCLNCTRIFLGRYKQKPSTQIIPYQDKRRRRGVPQPVKPPRSPDSKKRCFADRQPRSPSQPRMSPRTRIAGPARPYAPRSRPGPRPRLRPPRRVRRRVRSRPLPHLTLAAQPATEKEEEEHHRGLCRPRARRRQGERATTASD